MPLKVIGAAMPRTGTVSLKVALEMLGFGRCYHMSELIVQPEHAPLLARAPERPENFDQIFRGYQATVDFPGSAVWRELAGYYPDAKVILTRRDPDKWFDSVQSTVGKPGHRRMLTESPLAPVVARFTPLGPEPDNRDISTQYFVDYGEAVKAAIPPERLLVFEASEGWEPLCAFLGVPVPADVPYPRLNDRDTMQSGGDLEHLSFEQIQTMVRTTMLA